MSLLERLQSVEVKLERRRLRKKERARKKARRPKKSRKHKNRHVQKRKHQIAKLKSGENYYQTVWWKRRRLEFLSRYPKCYVCESTESLHVHHVRYTSKGGAHVFFREQDRDLRTACGKCHYKAHYYKMEGIFTAKGLRFRQMFEVFVRLPSVSTGKPKKGETVIFGPPDVDLPWDSVSEPLVEIAGLQLKLKGIENPTDEEIEAKIERKRPERMRFKKEPPSKLDEGYEMTKNPKILIRRKMIP